MLVTLTRTITNTPSAVFVVPNRSVRGLLGGCMEVTMKASLPSRTLLPMVAVAGAKLVALSTFDSRALVVKSKILGSLPPVPTLMITKRRKTADGRVTRFLVNHGCVAVQSALSAAACGVTSSGDMIPGDGVVS